MGGNRKGKWEWSVGKLICHVAMNITEQVVVEFNVKSERVLFRLCKIRRLLVKTVFDKVSGFVEL